MTCPYELTQHLIQDCSLKVVLTRFPPFTKLTREVCVWKTNIGATIVGVGQSCRVLPANICLGALGGWNPLSTRQLCAAEPGRRCCRAGVLNVGLQCQRDRGAVAPRT